MRSLRMLCFLACGVPAFGTAITGAFEPPTGDLGSSTHTYTFSGWSIVATAFWPGNPAPDLFGKAAGSGETGLGLTNDPTGDDEITGTSFIQLDITNIFNNVHNFSPFTITMNSTTTPDAWQISQSNAFGVLGTCSLATPCATGTTNTSITISPKAGYVYMDIKATGGNVLLSSISFDDGGGGGQGVPEPLSSALVGGGLIGMYFIRRRCPGSR